MYIQPETTLLQATLLDQLQVQQQKKKATFDTLNIPKTYFWLSPALFTARYLFIQQTLTIRAKLNTSFVCNLTALWQDLDSPTPLSPPG